MNHFTNFSVGIVFYCLGVCCGAIVTYVLMEVFPGIFPSLSRQQEMDHISMDAKIRAAFKASGGNITHAAAILGTTKNVLTSMCLGLGISPELYARVKK